MFSSSQWSFNPAMYQNIPYEQVDWASLAQQWIKMKETVPIVNQGPPVPPVSQISKPPTNVPPVPKPTAAQTEPSNDIEGGEAPMDMDTKDDEALGPVGVSQGGNWNQWNNWPNQWGWGWSGNSGTVPLDDTASSTSSTIDSKPYWNDDSFSPTPGKLSADSWGKGHKIPERNHPKPISEQFQVMDAVKKKQLPAWIREGLNKMEREKQKKLERERMMQEKILRDQIRGEQEKEAPAERTMFTPFNTTPPKEEETKKSPVPSSASRYQQKNYTQPNPDPPLRHRSLSRSSKEDVSGIRKTKDQIMEESMLKVRRILTEILLEATENQVQLIAKEEFRRAKSSASAQQIRKSNALSSLTGNLGLDIYESESESSGSESQRDDRRMDSDEELKMIIDKKKRDFQRIEDEIELEIEDQEAKERLIAQQELDNEEGNDDDDDAEDAGKFSREKTNYESTRRLQDPGKENREDRGSVSNYGKCEEAEIHQSRSSSKLKLNSQTDKINGDKRKKTKESNAKSKIKTSSSSSASSSSLSSSSSSSSSASTSSESSSGSSDSSNSESEHSHSDTRLSKKKRKLDARRREKEKLYRTKRYRSRSRSSSRSRYSRSDRKHDTKNRKSESVDKRKLSPHRRRSRSSSYRKRSPSYRRGSRETSRSRYKETSRNYESKRKRRSSSTDSKHSHHKRR